MYKKQTHFYNLVKKNDVKLKSLKKTAKFNTI